MSLISSSQAGQTMESLRIHISFSNSDAELTLSATFLVVQSWFIAGKYFLLFKKFDNVKCLKWSYSERGAGKSICLIPDFVTWTLENAAAKDTQGLFSEGYEGNSGR